MKKTIFLIAFIPLLFGACQQKVYFNDFEKSFLDIYEVGDTLVFESDRGKRDTAYILDKNIKYAAWNPLAHSGKYKMLSGRVFEAQNWLSDGKPDLREHISLIKSHPDTTIIYIAYKDIIMMKKFSNFSKLSLEQYKVDINLYQFPTSYSFNGKDLEKHLYWHLKYGLVKYITKEGEVWRRINIEK